MSFCLRARAPLRLGLAGGGTDLSPFCDQHGGAVLNCTIDRYAYATINTHQDHCVRFAAKDLGVIEEFSLGKTLDTSAGLRIHKSVYNYFLASGMQFDAPGIEVITYVDCPPGSGLGSSSALTVALCEAFRSLSNSALGLYDLANLAYHIERVDLSLAGGKQDQYSAAFGGVNFIEFFDRGRVIVNPLRVADGMLFELEASLVLCFTGVSRDSDKIIADQTLHMRSENPTAMAALGAIKENAILMKASLLTGDLKQMADLLNAGWAEKKKTSNSVSSQFIEQLLGVGAQSGALAAKVSGAGGGGFIMFITNPEDRLALINGLNAAGAVAGPVHFTGNGVRSWKRPGL